LKETDMLTPETVQKTREWFAANALACIAEAESGAVRVNDLAFYRSACLKSYEEYLAGRWDHTFTFQQRAHYIQTGECIALLPR
jgi:hypothetical protein